MAAAMIGLLGLMINGRLQRGHETKLKAADHAHETKLKELQLGHERALDLRADERRLRDQKLERVRIAMKIIIEDATKAFLLISRMFPSALVEGAGVKQSILDVVPSLDERKSEEFAQSFEEIVTSIQARVADLEIDAESHKLAQKVRGVVTVIGGIVGTLALMEVIQQRGVPMDDPQRTQLLKEMQSVGPELLQQTEAISSEARTLLANLEKPIE